MKMNEDTQWYVVRTFLYLVASYLVIKVVQTRADVEMPSAFKNFEQSLKQFQKAVLIDVDENGNPELDEEYQSTENPNDND